MPDTIKHVKGKLSPFVFCFSFGAGDTTQGLIHAEYTLPQLHPQPFAYKINIEHRIDLDSVPFQSLMDFMAEKQRFCGWHGALTLPSSLQKLNVVEQEKIDNLMIEMDGTENKCEWL